MIGVVYIEHEIADHPRTAEILRRFPKATRTAPLEAVEPLPNCVVAWSFTPQEVSSALEHKVPSVDRRLRPWPISKSGAGSSACASIR